MNRKREKELETTNQQLDAANQQLLASEQQLKALNQQLLASEQQLMALNEQLKASELELKKKEHHERLAKEFAENIIATVRNPLLILDQDLKVISANSSFYSTFKVSQKDIAGILFFKLGNSQWNIPSLLTLMNEILPRKAAVEDYEVDHTFLDIGRKIMLLNARELKNQRGKERMILLSIQDITDRRTFETQLQSLNAELEAKTKELQQLLYITTHDLRSPLVNIQGFNKELEASINELTRLFKDEEIPDIRKEKYNLILDEEIPEAMHFITSSTTKMDALLSGLLTLSRLERQKMVFQELDMNLLMQKVTDNYEYHVTRKKIELETDKLPPCIGDELQINQLFSNLIDNSLKFFDPKRPGRITITGEKQAEFSKYVIEDNGIGIHKDHQDKVFELFHKLDPQKKGIGLGMNIVKQIVEKHKGRIELESETDRGTKIRVFLPNTNFK